MQKEGVSVLAKPIPLPAKLILVTAVEGQIAQSTGVAGSATDAEPESRPHPQAICPSAADSEAAHESHRLAISVNFLRANHLHHVLLLNVL